MDDVIVTRNNVITMESIIKTLSPNFALKDFGKLHYFLGIGINYFTKGVVLSQS